MSKLKLPAKAPEPVVDSTANPDANIERLAPTPELNPRNQILQDIAEHRKVEADAEAQESVPQTDDEGNLVDPPLDTAAPDTPPHQSAAAEPALEEVPAVVPVAAVPQFDPEQEYELKINGQMVKVKGSQIVEHGKAALQKDIAADQKLQMASNLLAEAQAQRTATAAAPVQTQAALTDQQLAEIVPYCTPEQIAELFKNVRTPDTSKEELKALADNMPRFVNDQIAFNNAAQFAQTEYGDLLSDPYLQPLFLMKENQLRATGDQRPHKDLYRAIGEDLRTHFNRPKPTAGSQAETPKTMEQKQAAKAAAPAAPRLASTRLEAQEAPKPKTAEDIITAMQRSRGLRQGRDLH